MKKLIFASFIFFSPIFCYSQADSTLTHFLELVDKVQNDKSLSGTFIYKGYKVNISEYKEYKTTIGKFIEVKWAVPYIWPPTAVFHNSLGYMTHRIFNLYKYTYKDFKTEKGKYCKDNICIELRDDKKLPYILTHQIGNSEIREIK